MPKVTAKHWPWSVTLFLTMLFWLHTCNLNKRIDKAEEQVVQLNLENQKDKEIINKRNMTIRTQEAVITRNQASLSNLTDTIFNLRNKDARNLETIAYYKGVTKTVIKNVPIPYLDTVRMKRLTDSMMATKEGLMEYIENFTVEVPKKAGYETKHMKVDLTVGLDDVNIDSLIVPDSLYLRFVERGGFLRRKTVEVQYFHTNPYIKSISSQSAFYKPRGNFWKNVVLPVAVGIGAGILISK